MIKEYAIYGLGFIVFLTFEGIVAIRLEIMRMLQGDEIYKEECKRCEKVMIFATNKVGLLTLGYCMAKGCYDKAIMVFCFIVIVELLTYRYYHHYENIRRASLGLFNKTIIIYTVFNYLRGEFIIAAISLCVFTVTEYFLYYPKVLKAEAEMQKQAEILNKEE